jgi:hypothetical protein
MSNFIHPLFYIKREARQLMKAFTHVKLILQHLIAIINLEI